MLFAECSRWSRASQLGPYKIPYVALANSKEHEVQVRAASSRGRAGRACGTAGPGTSPSDGRENFPSQKPNEHDSNSPRKARRPARGERLRFLEPDRRRTGRPGADREWEPARNVPQPPPFRRRELLSDGSSRLGRIPRAPGDSQLDDHRLVPACQRVAAQTRIAARVATNLAWHFLLLIPALHLGTAASSS